MTLLEMSCAAAIMIASILLLRTLAFYRLPKKTFPILWAVVLARLLLPFSLPSPWSAYSLTDRAVAAMPDLPVKISILLSAPSRGENPSLSAWSPAAHSLWTILWLAGFLLFSLYFTISYFRCLRQWRDSLPLEEEFTVEWLGAHSLKRPLEIRQSSRIATPLTYGILRPVILLPKSAEQRDREKLGYILQHEFQHIRRFHAVFKLLLAAALCLHWFNPAVWAMFVLANRDLELSCDEGVLNVFGETAKSHYAMTLIGMEARKSGLPSLSSGFCRNATEERIRAIMKYRKTSVCTAILPLLLAASLTLVFATSPPAGGSRPAPPDSAPAIVYDNVDLRFYDNGWPYLHDVLSNRTEKTIVAVQYCMLAYDESGEPLALQWNILDSSDESSYECLVERETSILPQSTDDSFGGWSLYDEEKMSGFPKPKHGGPNKVAYALYCIRKATFADGSVWENPDFENWLSAYRGKRTPLSELKNYYPYEQMVTE